MGKVSRDRLDVGRSRFEKVDDGDIGDRVSSRIDVSSNRLVSRQLGSWVKEVRTDGSSPPTIANH